MEKVLRLRKEQLTVVMMLYNWWSERNRFHKEGKRRGAAELTYIAAFQADRFQALQKPNLLSEISQSARQTACWTKPPVGVLKVNSDCAFEFLQSAFHAEMLGCIAGLKQASALGIMETDASPVKMALMTDDYRLSNLGGLATEAKHIMAEDFAECSLNVCPRSCNSVVHLSMPWQQLDVIC